MCPSREYRQNTHFFFDQLVTFLGAFTTFALGVDAQMRGQTSSFPPGQSIIFDGKSHVSNIRLKFYPQDLLQCLVAQRWPESLVFHDLPMEQSANNRRPSVTFVNAGRYINYHLMYSYIHYFESNRITIESNFNENPQQWPPVWNFGRVVRNAFAHGGVINFQREYAPPVNWLSLTYSPIDNGHQIIENDFACVEIILLMEDMDQHL